MSTNAPATNIAEVSAPDPEDFERLCVKPGSPVLIRGALDGSTALTEWSFDYFRSAFPEQRVFCADPKEFDTEHSLTLKEYVEGIGTHSFATAWVREPVPGFFTGLALPDYSHGRVASRWAFIGRDSRTVLHYHARHQSILAQIRGAKRFYLYPPSLTRHLRPNAWPADAHNISRYGMNIPDPSSFPEAVRHRIVVADLAPGDIIYVPPHWWHLVESIGDSVSATLFWDARLRELNPRGALGDLIHRRLDLPRRAYRSLRARFASRV